MSDEGKSSEPEPEAAGASQGKASEPEPAAAAPASEGSGPEPEAGRGSEPEAAADGGADAGSAHSAGEALGLLALGMLLFAAADGIGRSKVTALAELAPALRVLAWIVPAYGVLYRRGLDPFAAHRLIARPRGLGVATVVSLAILGVYVAVVVLRANGGVEAVIPWTAALTLFAHDLIFVALPEEYFFRGVLQPSLDRPGGLRILGGRIGLGVVAAAALFALCHLALDQNPLRLLVFFPALWFGWLTDRTGSVVPAIVAHALANAVQLACFEAWLR